MGYETHASLAPTLEVLKKLLGKVVEEVQHDSLQTVVPQFVNHNTQKNVAEFEVSHFNTFQEIPAITSLHRPITPRFDVELKPDKLHHFLLYQPGSTFDAGGREIQIPLVVFIVECNYFVYEGLFPVENMVLNLAPANPMQPFRLF